MNGLTKEQIKDVSILAEFISHYCHAEHSIDSADGYMIPEHLQKKGKQAVVICSDCGRLLEHGITKRRCCPLNPKPTCRKCHIHCYTPEYRDKIRKIMAFSGRKLIMRGRLDYLWHYFIKS